ncbi:MAG TPA: hypothetical protein VKF84_07495 [Candidatus Sulfotelmatobacter sp.]|nr:hypothetical protein [Candidatus Sulfotelmatobacter sp.]
MNDDHTNQLDLETQYREMASDATHEREAEEWIEGLIADVSTDE